MPKDLPNTIVSVLLGEKLGGNKILCNRLFKVKLSAPYNDQENGKYVILEQLAALDISTGQSDAESIESVELDF